MSVKISDQLLSQLVPLVQIACVRAGARVVATSKYGKGGEPNPAGVPIDEQAVRYLIGSTDEHIKIVAHAIERTPSPFALEDSAFNLGIMQMEPQCKIVFGGTTVSDTSIESARVSNYRPGNVSNNESEVVYLDLRVDLQAVSTAKLNFDRLAELTRLLLSSGTYVAPEVSVDDVEQTITVSGWDAQKTSWVIDNLRGAQVIDQIPAPEALSPVGNRIGLYLESSLYAMIDDEELQVFSLKSDNVDKPLLAVYLSGAPEMRQDIAEILQRIPAMYDEGKIRVHMEK